MKRAVLIAAGMLLAMVCAAQMPPGHVQTGGGDSHGGMQGSQGIVASSRTEFGAECGIRDTATSSALGFARSNDGEWAPVSAERGGGSTDNMVARLWRESNWMVDLHGALGQGMMVMHSGQMCFDPQGRIMRMFDRYLDLAACGCMRFTALTYANDGRVTRREQRFLNVSTGVEMKTPDAAVDFPEVWEFRKVEQLPFYSLVKK